VFSTVIYISIGETTTMSITERMENHQEDIARVSQNVQDLMVQSETGVALMQASTDMATSEEMQNLMTTIDHPNASEQDKFLMGKYMGQMLQSDQKNGLINYAAYLRDVANNPTYTDRKDYFNAIAEAALQLNSSTAFQSYLLKYQAFEADTSDTAAATRKAMEDMSQKMREWIEGEESTN
jgi:DNA-binding ferritin-like protein